jgi:hypothetical protein
MAGDSRKAESLHAAPMRTNLCTRLIRQFGSMVEPRATTGVLSLAGVRMYSSPRPRSVGSKSGVWGNHLGSFLQALEK